MPINSNLIEAIVLTCLEADPIDFRNVDEGEVRRALAAIRRAAKRPGAALRYGVTRKQFLCACGDLTKRLTEEHLIVGYGYHHGSTTRVEKVHHVVGQERGVGIPEHVRTEIRRHHVCSSDAEVIVFHNHPRTGAEPDWVYTLKTLLHDSPIASNDDRKVLQRYAFNAVALLRQVTRQGEVLFYLGESGYVKRFQFPPLLPLLAHLNWP
jgi:hypothetical protein